MTLLATFAKLKVVMEVGIYLSPLAVGTLHGLPLQDVIWSSACCRLNTLPLQCSQVCRKQLAHVTEGNCINLPIHYCCYITYCMFYDLITKDYYGWFRLEKIIILRASAFWGSRHLPSLHDTTYAMKLWVTITHSLPVHSVSILDSLLVCVKL